MRGACCFCTFFLHFFSVLVGSELEEHLLMVLDSKKSINEK